MPNLPDDQAKNVELVNTANDKSVTITTDGAKERLDVSADIVGGSFSLSAFNPETDFSVANTALNTSTDTTLYTETAEGKIDFIVIVGSNSNYEVVLVVDTVEIFRIKMSELATLGLSNATNVAMWAETANKNFRYHPNEGVDHLTSWSLKAKATGNPTPTVNWLINHREIV